jgi:endonuclease YncB( thermonuclease family)
MRLIPLFALGRLIVGPAVALPISGPAKVIDAEILRVGGQLIRLSGIAAPKPGDKCAMRKATIPCGRGATAALMDLTAGAEVRCQTHGGSNPKGIMLATCTASD